MPQADRSSCETVLGCVAREEARIDDAITHLQRAIAAARSAKDLLRLCRAQTHLIAIISDRYGPDASAPLIAELRANAIKVGDFHTTVALHLFVGEAEAKRGLLERASRHVGLATGLLSQNTNCWLESMAENLMLAIGLMRSDLKGALPHGLKAAELAEKSGSAIMLRASLGNLGNLFYLLGDFEKAIEYFEKGVNSLPSTGDTKNWSLESSARVRLSQGRLDDCERLLDEIESSIKCDEDKRLFAHRYAAMARALLLRRQGQFDRAFVQIEDVLALTRVTGDTHLKKQAQLTKADLLRQLGRLDEFRIAIDETLRDADSQSPEMFADYERIIAAACVSEARTHSAALHHQRAVRICKAIANVPIEMDVQRSWNEHDVDNINKTQAATVFEDDTAEMTTSALQSIWSLLANASYPEVLGRELFALLKVSGTVHQMKVYLRGAADEITPIEFFESEESNLRLEQERVFVIGRTNQGTVELLLRAKSKADSIATINAVSRLLQAIEELRKARVDRQDRAPLWPADDPNMNREGAVISGKMHELMTFARRVARTTVGVLITGPIDPQQVPINRGFPQARGDRHAHGRGKTAARPQYESAAA